MMSDDPAMVAARQEKPEAGSTTVQVRALDIHKVFQRGSERIDVLQGVDLEIPQGDFVALMGPSGSGKTTLLNLIGGLDSPTQGTIEVGGKRVDQLRGGRLTRWRRSGRSGSTRRSRMAR